MWILPPVLTVDGRGSGTSGTCASRREVEEKLGDNGQIQEPGPRRLRQSLLLHRNQQKTQKECRWGPLERILGDFNRTMLTKRPTEKAVPGKEEVARGDHADVDWAGLDP